MKIALDYDLTYTLDPEQWEYVINEFRNWDTDIRVVTMRCPEKDTILDMPGDLFREALPIIYCDGRPKRDVCKELGWIPDIWIDDKPESVDGGSTMTTEQLHEWRENGRV